MKPARLRHHCCNCGVPYRTIYWNQTTCRRCRRVWDALYRSGVVHVHPAAANDDRDWEALYRR